MFVAITPYVLTIGIIPEVANARIRARKPLWVKSAKMDIQNCNKSQLTAGAHFIAATASALRECKISTAYAEAGLNTNSNYTMWSHNRVSWTQKRGAGKRNTLTPKPLRKKQTKLSVNPMGPSIYSVTIPDKITDNGIIIRAPLRAVRSRSSGYHTPPRNLW